MSEKYCKVQMNLLNDIALFRSLRAEIKYYSKARRVEMTKITKTASPKNKRFWPKKDIMQLFSADATVFFKKN